MNEVDFGTKILDKTLTLPTRIDSTIRINSHISSNLNDKAYNFK